MSRSEVYSWHKHRVYLDKIITAPHFPKRTGQTGFNSLSVLPDLSHTGLATSLQPPLIKTIDEEGYINPYYRYKSYRSAALTERSRWKFEYEEYFHTKNHKAYLNKLLVDLEEAKRAKIERNEMHWRESKSSLGFENSFNMGEDSFFTEINTFDLNSIQENSEFHSNPKSDDLLSSINDSLKNVRFNLEIDPDSLENAVKESIILNPIDNKEANESHPIAKPSPGVTKPSTAVSSVGSKSKSMKSMRSFTGNNRKKKAPSRNALFECLLETLEPPKSPKKRFGAIGNPIPPSKTVLEGVVDWTPSDLYYDDYYDGDDGHINRSLESRSSVTSKGFDKWDIKAIEKAHFGDKKYRNSKERCVTAPSSILKLRSIKYGSVN